MSEPAPEPAPEAIPRMPFDHEKLDVYGLAIDFVSRDSDVVEALPRGRGYLADQLQRAASSIVLNIAEGAGKLSGDDNAAFYARARGSATESAAVLDVCAHLNLLPATVCQQHKTLLDRVTRMSTKLIRDLDAGLGRGLGRSRDPQHEESLPIYPWAVGRGGPRAAVAHGTTVNGCIMSLSSCSTMWQWWT